jgi:CheY-like chemotaxis protein
MPSRLQDAAGPDSLHPAFGPNSALAPATRMGRLPARIVPPCFARRLAVDVRQGKRILVVEDNEFTREGMAVVLRRSGCEGTAVAERGEAPALIRGGLLPDLVLLDMMFPGLDGWYFFTERQRNPAMAAIPVLIQTSLGVASQEWAAGLGACGLIRKPIESALLLEKVRCCFRQAGEPT